MAKKKNHLVFQGTSKAIKSPGRWQILALSGGGYRGIYTATLLSKMETSFKTPIRDHFDLIIGTSAGALIAASLACGVPAQLIAELFAKAGPTIFPEIPIYTKAGKIIMGGSAHTMDAIEILIDELLNPYIDVNQPMVDLDIPLAVNAVSYTSKISRIYACRQFVDDKTVKASLKDAIIASASAPTFFPTRDIEGEAVVDGGLVANAPDIVGLSLALRHLKAKLDKIYLLSIGTAAPKGGVTPGKQKNSGKLGWILTEHHIIDLMLAAQEHLSIRIAKDLLGSRYTRIDKKPSTAEAMVIKDLDNASEEAKTVLTYLANETWNESTQGNGLKRLKTWFSHTPVHKKT